MKSLQEQLTDLQKKEIVAQTREQYLQEEKEKLLEEAEELLSAVKELGIVPIEELTPARLSQVVEQLHIYVEKESMKINIPTELQ